MGKVFCWSQYMIVQFETFTVFVVLCCSKDGGLEGALSAELLGYHLETKCEKMWSLIFSQGSPLFYKARLPF